jgi:hypothetical protein
MQTDGAMGRVTISLRVIWLSAVFMATYNYRKTYPFLFPFLRFNKRQSVELRDTTPLQQPAQICEPGVWCVCVRACRRGAGCGVITAGYYEGCKHQPLIPALNDSVPVLMYSDKAVFTLYETACRPSLQFRACCTRFEGFHGCGTVDCDILVCDPCCLVGGHQPFGGTYPSLEFFIHHHNHHHHLEVYTASQPGRPQSAHISLNFFVLTSVFIFIPYSWSSFPILCGETCVWHHLTSLITCVSIYIFSWTLNIMPLEATPFFVTLYRKSTKCMILKDCIVIYSKMPRSCLWNV